MSHTATQKTVAEGKSQQLGSPFSGEEQELQQKLNDVEEEIEQFMKFHTSKGQGYEGQGYQYGQKGQENKGDLANQPGEGLKGKGGMVSLETIAKKFDEIRGMECSKTSSGTEVRGSCESKINHVSEQLKSIRSRPVEDPQVMAQLDEVKKEICDLKKDYGFKEGRGEKFGQHVGGQQQLGTQQHQQQPGQQMGGQLGSQQHQGYQQQQFSTQQQFGTQQQSRSPQQSGLQKEKWESPENPLAEGKRDETRDIEGSKYAAAQGNIGTDTRGQTEAGIGGRTGTDIGQRGTANLGAETKSSPTDTGIQGKPDVNANKGQTDRSKTK